MRVEGEAEKVSRCGPVVALLQSTLLLDLHPRTVRIGTASGQRCLELSGAPAFANRHPREAGTLGELSAPTDGLEDRSLGW